jgi:hypothetical protein
MSYQLDSLYPRVQENTLRRQHMDLTNWDKKPVDIVTIGDSFSQGGASGKNAFYQDYLATNCNLRVLNIQNQKNKINMIEMVYQLKNSSLLHTLDPKIILIESTERDVLKRFSSYIDSHVSKKNSLKNNLELQKALTKLDATADKPKVQFINNLNINALKYNLLYFFDDNAYSSTTYKIKLNKNVFTSKNQSTLLFYKDSINYNNTITQEKVRQLNDNFNRLALSLQSRGIQLVFMPIVDKYNLYENFIADNKHQQKYGQSTFFELLRPMRKYYTLVDTKAILLPLVEKNIPNIFYSDDTHWGYVASDVVSREFCNASKQQ